MIDHILFMLHQLTQFNELFHLNTMPEYTIHAADVWSTEVIASWLFVIARYNGSKQETFAPGGFG